MGGELVEVPYTRGYSSTLIGEALREETLVRRMRQQQLRSLMEDNAIVRVIEAHNAISAAIAERANVAGRQFHALWSSSLTDSLTRGKPDIEIVDTVARLTTVGEILEATSKPILYDGDTGGSVERVHYLTRAVMRAGISALCLEDKVGAKRNSLYGTNGMQRQADIEEFCGKISVAREAVEDSSLVLIGRIESLVLGKPMKDAIDRAESYCDAGVDAILIHSISNAPNEVFEFARTFRRQTPRVPLAVVPTTFGSTYEEQLIDHGINVVIYANHLLRAAYPAMARVAAAILAHGRSSDVESDCARPQEMLALFPEPRLSSHEFYGRRISRNQSFRVRSGSNPHQSSSRTTRLRAGLHKRRKQMISAADFITRGLECGFDFYAGVPCSFLTPLINALVYSPAVQYVGAASEGEAIAIAAGGWLAGRRTVVICQNSGLGNAVNPLTSLNYPFQIPTLLVTTWRGEPGIKDEPQHELMGGITPRLLSLLEVHHRCFPTEAAELAGALDDAAAMMESTSLPFAFVMARDTIRPEEIDVNPSTPRPPGIRHDYCTAGIRPARSDVLKSFLGIAPDGGAVVSTTGMTSRELFTLEDRRQHLYMVGSMGCAAGIALGVALNTQRPVFVLDGDGAALMKLGTLATIGAYAPQNLIHVILDNGVHDSTGRQPTVSGIVDFGGVAIACGYRFAAACDDVAGFGEAVGCALSRRGPALIHAKIRPGSMHPLGRPSFSPVAVARRFKQFLAEEANDGREK
jgi:phosphonopyruvate decarboxylase